ncbi:MAG: FtsL-like putative cell division protein [Marinifilaceae bacterium]|nr:FtsL-like putative cell division protein [Marinifilaceae bacterium]
MGWFKKQKVKDFVSPLQEQKEVLGESMKDLLDGKLLVDTGLRRNIRFIMFLTLLGILYIANGYHTEKLYMEKVALEKEVSELRFEAITTAAELMKLSVQSEVERRIHEAGLDLVQTRVPPIKIER